MNRSGQAVTASPVRAQAIPAAPPRLTWLYLLAATGLTSVGVYAGYLAVGTYMGYLMSGVQTFTRCGRLFPQPTPLTPAWFPSYEACLAPHYRFVATGTLTWTGGLLLATALLLVVVPAYDALRLRRHRWDAPPGAVERFAALCDAHGLTADPTPEHGPGLTAEHRPTAERRLTGRRRPRLVVAGPRYPQAQTTGFPGRRPVVVLPLAVALRHADADAFDPIVAHELAHVRAGDVHWVALVRGGLWLTVPALLFAELPALLGWLIMDGVAPVALVPIARGLVLVVLVALLRAGLLRARERQADAYAAATTGDTGLRRALGPAPRGPARPATTPRPDPTGPEAMGPETTHPATTRPATIAPPETTPRPWRPGRVVSVLRRPFARHPSTRERLAALDAPDVLPGGFGHALVTGVVTVTLMGAISTLVMWLFLGLPSEMTSTDWTIWAGGLLAAATLAPSLRARARLAAARGVPARWGLPVGGAALGWALGGVLAPASAVTRTSFPPALGTGDAAVLAIGLTALAGAATVATIAALATAGAGRALTLVGAAFAAIGTLTPIPWLLQVYTTEEIDARSLLTGMVRVPRVLPLLLLPVVFAVLVLRRRPRRPDPTSVGLTAAVTFIAGIGALGVLALRSDVEGTPRVAALQQGALVLVAAATVVFVVRLARGGRTPFAAALTSAAAVVACGAAGQYAVAASQGFPTGVPVLLDAYLRMPLALTTIVVLAAAPLAMLPWSPSLRPGGGAVGLATMLTALCAAIVVSVDPPPADFDAAWAGDFRPQAAPARPTAPPVAGPLPDAAVVTVVGPVLPAYWHRSAPDGTWCHATGEASATLYCTRPGPFRVGTALTVVVSHAPGAAVLDDARRAVRAISAVRSAARCSALATRIGCERLLFALGCRPENTLTEHPLGPGVHRIDRRLSSDCVTARITDAVATVVITAHGRSAVLTMATQSEPLDEALLADAVTRTRAALG